MTTIGASSQTKKTQTTNAVGLSIIIPVYNEEALLASAIEDLNQKLDNLGWDYELLITENGSTDRSQEIIKELENKYRQIRGLHTDEPNYGLALRRAIKAAGGTYILCDEIDICDTDFYQRALAILESEHADLVIGSKRHPEARDRRPWIRRLATATVNFLLNILLDFKGTDTHGLKAFHRQRLLPIVDQCIVDKDLFATELVIRAQQANYRTIEIPIELEEKRQTPIPLFRRVPKALKQILRLVAVIRFNQKV
ncbi:MAG: glycosyltransferase family 2 protein [Symploca sp. SIO2C1]|nr:glycosyltransferase family 2 protein [Symploca sp. SIO2C1]